MPKKYVPYYPQPVEGQALLNNFKRTLRYNGDDEVYENLRRGMPYYEIQKTEQVGSDSNDNMVIRGECLSTCAYMKEHNIEADLVYIDPPFASGADYAKQVYIRRNPKVALSIDKAEKELADVGEEVNMSDEFRSFEEKMYGDIWDKERYLNWMFENLMAIKSIMSENAIIWVHLDHSMGFYVKVLLDEIFGEDNWLNTITWRSQVARGAKVNAFYYPYSSQYLMIYAKNLDRNECVWNVERREVLISPEEAEKDYYKDEYGYFRTSDPGSYGFQKIIEFEKENRIYVTKGGELVLDYKNETFSTTKGTIGIKYYLENRGNYYVAERAIDNIWDDVPGLGTTPKEDVGYATQKTEALLERIIKASSNENMLVCDFFGGSGVTAAVAAKLNRRFITCDIGINSIQTMRDRLYKDGATFSVYEIQDGVSLFRNPVQTMDKLYSLIPGLKKDATISGFWAGSFTDTRHGTIPVYVPNLMDSSSKILDLPAINEIVHVHLPDLPGNTQKAVVYYIDITDEAEIKRFIREENPTLIEIELRDLKTVLSDVVINDEVKWTVKEDSSTLIPGYTVNIDSFISDRVLGKIEAYNAKSQLQATGRKKFIPIQISDTGLECIEYLSLDCTSDSGKWHSDSDIIIDKKGFITVNGNETKEFWDGTIKSTNKPLRLKIRNICGDESIINLN